MEHGDFLEGIRAAIIDKDRSPQWQHSSGRGAIRGRLAHVDAAGARKLTFEEAECK